MIYISEYEDFYKYKSTEELMEQVKFLSKIILICHHRGINPGVDMYNEHSAITIMLMNRGIYYDGLNDFWNTVNCSSSCNRNYIGFDFSNEYYEIALKRILSLGKE